MSNESHLNNLFQLIQAIGNSIINARRYDASSPQRISDIQNTFSLLSPLLESVGKLTFEENERRLSINSKVLSEEDMKLPHISSFFATLSYYRIGSISFSQGLTKEEYSKFIEIISKRKGGKRRGLLNIEFFITSDGRYIPVKQKEGVEIKEEDLSWGDVLKHKGITHIIIEERDFEQLASLNKIMDLEKLLNEQGFSIADIPPEVITKFLVEKFNVIGADDDKIMSIHGNYDKVANLITESEGLPENPEVFEINDRRLQNVTDSIEDVKETISKFKDPKAQEVVMEELANIVASFKPHILSETMSRSGNIELPGGKNFQVLVNDILGNDKKVKILEHMMSQFNNIKLDKSADEVAKKKRMENFMDLIEKMFTQNEGVVVPDQLLEQLSNATFKMGILTDRQISREVLEKPRKACLKGVEELITGSKMIVTEDGEEWINLGDLVPKLVALNKTELIEELPQAIENSLKSDSPVVREKAVESLVDFNEELIKNTMDNTLEDVVEVLEDQMEKEEVPSVFSAIVKTLEKTAEKLLTQGKYNTATHIIELFNKYRDMEEYKDAKGELDEAVTRIAKNTEMLELLKTVYTSTDEETQNSVMAALASIRELAVPALLQVIRESKAIKAVKGAGDTLVKIGKFAVPAIIEELNTCDNPTLKRHLINALGRIGGIAAFEELKKLMEDKNPIIRREVIRAATLSPEGIPDDTIFFDGLKDEDPLVQKIAIAQLGNMKSKKAIPELLKFIKIELFGQIDPSLFKEAIIALGKTEDVSVVEPLLNIIKSKKIMFLKDLNRKKVDYKALKLAAISALGEITDESSQKILLKFYNGKDPVFKNAAEEALKRLDDKKLGIAAAIEEELTKVRVEEATTVAPELQPYKPEEQPTTIINRSDSEEQEEVTKKV